MKSKLACLISNATSKYIVICLLGGLFASSVTAQEWTAGDGVWFDNSNWSGGLIPTLVSTVEINNGFTVDIDNDSARAQIVYLGRSVGESGYIEADGVTDTWTGNTTLYVGRAGTGGLDMTNAAQVNPGIVYIGDLSTASGTVMIDGAGTVLTTSGVLRIGDAGTGVMTISGGGILSTNGFSIDIGLVAGSNGTLNIGAGGVAGILDLTTIVGGAGTATVNFNHSEDPFYLTDDATSGGGAVLITGSTAVTHSGSGTTVLSGNHTYTGATTINAGELRITGSIATSATAVNAAGTLAGTGTAGSVTVNGGAVAPGSSAGTLNVSQLILNSTSTLEMELDTAGVVGGGTNDLINVTGNLTLDGNLTIADLGAFGVGTYTLITYGGVLTDNGLDLPAPLAGLSYSVSSGAGTVTLEVETAHDLSYAAGANGSLTGMTSQTVADGDDGTAVTAVPNAGYMFSQWSDASTDNPRTDTNVTGDITVTAQFVVAPTPPPSGPLSINRVFNGFGTTLTDATIGPDAVISNVVLGSGMEIDPDAEFGPGVCFDSADSIPAGFDTARLFQSSPTSVNADLNFMDIDHAAICDAPTVLEEIILLDAFAGAAFEYDAETGVLSIAGLESLSRLLPIAILESDPDSPAGISEGEDGTLLLVTGTGYTIVVAPLLQDVTAIADVFAGLGLALSLDENGNLILDQNGSASGNEDEFVVARAVLPVLILPAGSAEGIVESDLFPSYPPAVTVVTTLEDGTVISQLLVSWPANWQELQNSLLSVAGVDGASIDQYGVIRISIDGETFAVRADYLVGEGAGASSGATTITPVGDLNGDGSVDFLITYSNGESQYLFVSP